MTECETSGEMRVDADNGQNTAKDPWWLPGNVLSSVLLGLALAMVINAFWSHDHKPPAKAMTPLGQFRAAAKHLGFPTHGTRYDARLSILRVVCVSNRPTFHTFATGSMQLRTTAPNPDGAARLDDLFRAAVHYLCPEREAELPRLSGATT